MSQMQMHTRGRPVSVVATFFAASTQAHAATLTQKALRSTFVTLERYAQKSRWGAVTPATITEKQLSRFVRDRLESGIEVRTIQNQMAHINRALIAVGRTEFSARPTNQDLGVPEGTRIGTGKATDPAVLAQALERANPTTRAWINAMQCLGLRQRELVRSGPSLKAWERQLAAGQPVQLVDGAKGGRSRQICVRPEGRADALQAVRDLIEVTKSQNGRVVDSKTLESACHMVSVRLAAVGLSGENSGHSLRRQFAVDQLHYYRSEGYDEKTARSLLSNDLGHGDKRGTWAWNNYCRCTEEAANDAAAYEVAA